MIDGVEENEKGGKMKVDQGMEAIEKTRWEGEKTVGAERF